MDPMSKPVVAFAVGGIPDIIENGRNGFLIPWCDIDLYSEKLVILAEDNNLRKTMGRNGISTVKNKFLIKDTMNKMIKIYESVV